MRHGLTHEQSFAHSSSAASDTRTAMMGISPNSGNINTDGPSGKREKSSNSSPARAGRAEVDNSRGSHGFRVNSESVPGLEHGMEVEDTLLTALEVVTLLVRHEPSDDAGVR